MLTEINLLDWIFAAGQGLFATSLVYFLYLVARHSEVAARVRGGLARLPRVGSGGRPRAREGALKLS